MKKLNRERSKKVVSLGSLKQFRVQLVVINKEGSRTREIWKWEQQEIAMLLLRQDEII